MSGRRIFRRMLVSPGDEEDEANAGADGGVCKVKGGKTDFLAIAAAQDHVEAEKVHDLVVDEAVGQISRDSAKKEAKGNLAGQFVHVEMVPCEEQGHEGQEHDNDKGAVIAAEQAPCRAGVAPEDKLEKAGNDDFFVTRDHRLQHEPFRKLVQGQNREREQGNAPVRLAENGFGSGHACQFPVSSRGFQANPERNEQRGRNGQTRKGKDELGCRIDAGKFQAQTRHIMNSWE